VKRFWLRVADRLRPFWRPAIAAALLGILGAFLSLMTPWPMKVIIDSVVGNHPLPAFFGINLHGLQQNRPVLLLITILASILLTVVQRVLELQHNYLKVKLNNRLVLSLRSDLFQHAQKLSLSYYHKRPLGDLLNRITSQSAAIGKIAVSVLPLTQSILTLIGMFWIACRLDVELALLSLAVVPFLYWSIGYYTRRVEPQVREIRKREADSLSILSEALSIMPITIAFGREQTEYERFRSHSEGTLDARLKLTQRQTFFSFLVNVTSAVGIAVVVALGSLHVLAGGLTVGLLIVIVSYINSLYAPLQTISGTVSSLQEELVDLRMAFEVLDTEPEIRDCPSARPIQRCKGHLIFDSVGFTYDGVRPILRGVSLEVRPGEFVGIVGPTGAGKTTLISLLPRFYAPRSGRILLDGIDLPEIQLRSLREQISLVTQQPLLFSGTVGDNISYGRLDATMEEIVHASRAADLHDFVSSLPQGYETQTGELISRFSTGELQRVTLARAFLKDAPVLVLDEPTSALDARTEASVMTALRRLAAGRTTLMIAHRLATVRGADRIIVMDQGRIVEWGTHEELMRNPGLYRHMFTTHYGESSGLEAWPARDASAKA
jgi:ATP-binding cassette, subfamily B, bacterial